MQHSYSTQGYVRCVAVLVFLTFHCPNIFLFVAMRQEDQSYVYVILVAAASLREGEPLLGYLNAQTKYHSIGQGIMQDGLGVSILQAFITYALKQITLYQ